MTDGDLRNLPVPQSLKLFGEVLEELRGRGVVLGWDRERVVAAYAKGRRGRRCSPRAQGEGCLCRRVRTCLVGGRRDERMAEAVTTMLPFLTDVDLLVSGEGILDPLGLSATADRLADQVLPGLRARMARPRFLTAMAVSAAVCEDLPDVGRDGVTAPHIVFEWLLTEGFARAGRDKDTVNTPGTLKAQAVCKSGEPMSARAYLKSPTVFGLHGVYKPVATAIGVITDDFALGEAGYELLRAWEREQGLAGFVDSTLGGGAGREMRLQVQGAVRDALEAGCTTRKPGWRGWDFFAAHLAPGSLGKSEAACLYRLLTGPGGRRPEVFELTSKPACYGPEGPEWELAGKRLKPHASSVLRADIEAVQAFERFATTLEAAFERLLFRSSGLRDRPLGVADFSADPDVVTWAAGLRSAVSSAEEALAEYPAHLQAEFGVLSKAFGHFTDAESLFHALLERHAAVQHAKKPDGKREWVEHSVNGGVFVRPLFRVEALEPPVQWGRPYRFSTVRSFCRDIYGTN